MSNHPIHKPTPASGRLLARVIGTRYTAHERPRSIGALAA
jgi:hypothetical protein